MAPELIRRLGGWGGGVVAAGCCTSTLIAYSCIIAAPSSVHTASGWTRFGCGTLPQHFQCALECPAKRNSRSLKTGLGGRGRSIFTIKTCDEKRKQTTLLIGTRTSMTRWTNTLFLRADNIFTTS